MSKDQPISPAVMAHRRAENTSASLVGAEADQHPVATAVVGAEGPEEMSGSRAIIRSLEQLGVTVVDQTPDQLPVALADHYLALKARGLL